MDEILKSEDVYNEDSNKSYTPARFRRIIQSTIKRKCKFHLDDSQFYLKNPFGTSETLFSMNLLIQKSRSQNGRISCFVNYEKTFNRVEHHKLSEI